MLNMKHTPCEYIVWHGLPMIRKEIAESLIIDHGLSQKETAKKLKISDAAVSQYLSGKRGNLQVIDKELNKEIKKSTRRIINQGDEILISEICRLCKIFAIKKNINFYKK